MENISRSQAVKSLGFTNFSGPDEVDGFIYHNEGDIPPTEAEIQTEIARLQASYDALDYARKRQAEYPDMGTQLNKIYDDGLTKWKSEMVDPIKAKYPKP